MFAFVGSHYPELVVIAMTLFAVGLFAVSVSESLKAVGKIDHN